MFTTPILWEQIDGVYNYTSFWTIEVKWGYCRNLPCFRITARSLGRLGVALLGNGFIRRVIKMSPRGRRASQCPFRDFPEWVDENQSWTAEEGQSCQKGHWCLWSFWTQRWELREHVNDGKQLLMGDICVSSNRVKRWNLSERMNNLHTELCCKWSKFSVKGYVAAWKSGDFIKGL